jgi:hypothetical protein
MRSFMHEQGLSYSIPSRADFAPCSKVGHACGFLLRARGYGQSRRFGLPERACTRVLETVGSRAALGLAVSYEPDGRNRTGSQVRTARGEACSHFRYEYDVR